MQDKGNSYIQNDTIEWLRFPLACAVVLIHAGASFSAEVTDFTTLFCAITSQGICRLAVPLFFVFSGYLFFVNLEKWDYSVWRNKLLRRLRTLVIPYLIWNAIAFMAAFLWQFIRIRHNGGMPDTIGDFWRQEGGLRVFWNSNGIMPFDYPLWFVRDLIIAIIFSPIIHWAIKHGKGFFILGLGLLYLIGGAKMNLSQGLFFFSLGSFFSIKRIRSEEIVNRHLDWAFLLLSLFLLILMALTYERSESYGYLLRLFTFVGSACLFRIIDRMVEKGKLHVNQFLAGSSFFIYAAHAILILPDFSHYCSMRLFGQVTDVSRICTILFDTVFTIAVSLFLYYVIKRFFPIAYMVLTGKKPLRQNK